MKLKFSFLLIFAAFMLSSSAFAQMDRSMARGQYKRPKPKKEKIDFIEETAKYLQKELKLDDFQAAAVREVIEAEKENLIALSQNPDMSENEREDKGREISDRIDGKILKLLSPEQQEKYKEMQKKKKKS